MDLLVSHQLHRVLLFSLSLLYVKHGFALENRWIRDATFDRKLPISGLPLISRSRIHCGKTCLEMETCASFFFAPTQNCNCRLLDHVLSSVEGLIDVEEVEYYILHEGSQSTTQSVPTVSTTSTTTTPSMTTSSTTSTTTSPSVSTSSTTSTTTTPSVSTSSTTSTTTPQSISCPPDGSGFTTVQLEDGNYFTYRVAKMLASQETAIQSCTNHGSFLARVTTVAKMNMLLQLIRTCSGYNSGLYDYYVDGSNAGATDFFAPGAWVMSNGDLVPMSNDFWGDMKPNYPETQHCLRMTADINFMWDDCSCSLEHYFICEK